MPLLRYGIQIVGAEPSSAAARMGRVRERGCPGSETSRTPPAEASAASASDADESDRLLLLKPPPPPWFPAPPSSEPVRAADAPEGPIGGLAERAALGDSAVEVGIFFSCCWFCCCLATTFSTLKGDVDDDDVDVDDDDVDDGEAKKEVENKRGESFSVDAGAFVVDFTVSAVASANAVASGVREMEVLPRIEGR